MTTLFLILPVVVVLLLGIAAYRARALDVTGKKLQGSFDRGYTIYVGFPLEKPEGWRLVRSISARKLETNDGASHPLNRVGCYVVADRTGVVVDALAPLDPLPLGLSQLGEELGTSKDLFTQASLELGATFLKVELHRAHGDHGDRCVIALENISKERIRIHAYAPYELTDIGPLCCTIGKTPHSRDEVREHFARDQEWLEPGEKMWSEETKTKVRWTWVFFFERERRGRGEAGASSEVLLPPLSPPPKRAALPALPPPRLELDAQLAAFLEMDLYAVLGLTKDAQADAVKKAFLLATKKWHPSQFANEPEPKRQLANEIFLRIKAAHDTLVDPAKRAAYDRRSERTRG